MILAILFFLAFSIVGISLISSGFSISSNFKGMSKWEMIEGKITHVKYNREWYELGEALDIKDELIISYEFEINGEKIHTNRISPTETKIIDKRTSFSKGFGVSNIQEFYNAIVTNPKVYVWVNPKRHSDSILINDIKSYQFKAYFGFVFIIWVIGIIMILAIRIDLSDSIEVLEEKTQIEKEAIDKAYK